MVRNWWVDPDTDNKRLKFEYCVENPVEYVLILIGMYANRKRMYISYLYAHKSAYLRTFILREACQTCEPRAIKMRFAFTARHSTRNRDKSEFQFFIITYLNSPRGKWRLECGQKNHVSTKFCFEGTYDTQNQLRMKNTTPNTNEKNTVKRKTDVEQSTSSFWFWKLL